MMSFIFLTLTFFLLSLGVTAPPNPRTNIDAPDVHFSLDCLIGHTVSEDSRALDVRDERNDVIPVLLYPPPRTQATPTASNIATVFSYSSLQQMGLSASLDQGTSSSENVFSSAPMLLTPVTGDFTLITAASPSVAALSSISTPPPLSSPTTLASVLPLTTVTVPLFFPPEIETETQTVNVTSTLTLVSTVTVPLPSPTSPHVDDPPPPPRPSSTQKPAPSPSLSRLEGIETWTMPWDLKDISPFKVTSFPGGQSRLKLVTGVSPKALPTTESRHLLSPNSGPQFQFKVKSKVQDTAMNGPPPISFWHATEVSLQLFYPAGSINPGRKPQGGAEFYASPLDLDGVWTSTLRYSVYFPLDFDWVLAGKLPGLYGGHTGCSGGNAALDCFSTRLMWREGGEGELYLYAAKDKQTKALCEDPQSVCDAVYGFSIGRGSFKWAAGEWTTVEQTVSLNTPGKQDGSFTLRVNGRTVIDRNDVFYRDVLWPGGKAPARPTNSVSRQPTTTKPVPPPPTKVSDPLGDILGPLLSEIGKLVGRENEGDGGGKTVALVYPDAAKTQAPILDPMKTKDAKRNCAPTLRESPQSWNYGGRSLADSDDDSEDKNNGSGAFSFAATPQRQGESIGLIGIFFSTFFGGHDDKYATPKDQYVWFKDFALAIQD